MFLQADKQWREVVRLIVEKPTALKAVTTPGTFITPRLSSCYVVRSFAMLFIFT
jgi:hypothetical protein